MIVCVLAATSDWESAAGISFAKKHDPSGERTLFVITQIDMVSPGFRAALDMLQLQYLRSKENLGYVLVHTYTGMLLSKYSGLYDIFLVHHVQGIFTRAQAA